MLRPESSEPCDARLLTTLGSLPPITCARPSPSISGLLSLVDPVLFGTESEFLGRYGDERTGMEAAQVQRLKVS